MPHLLESSACLMRSRISTRSGHSSQMTPHSLCIMWFLVIAARRMLLHRASRVIRVYQPPRMKLSRKLGACVLAARDIVRALLPALSRVS